MNNLGELQGFIPTVSSTHVNLTGLIFMSIVCLVGACSVGLAIWSVIERNK